MEVTDFSAHRNGPRCCVADLDSACHGHLPGQNFVSSGYGRGLLQDEDHSGSRPHSFPGLYSMRSGTSPEWFRTGPGVVGS